MRRLLNWFSRPSTRYGWGIIFLAGAAFFAVFWAGFNTVVQATNSTEFCVSCHSMHANYEEYKRTIHYSNRSGVRVECADCHVPKDFFPKMRAKVIAVKDIYHEIVGTVDTPEKFEARRLQMAEAVWAKMETTQSRECRTCHAFESMDFDEQGRRSSRRHEEAAAEGKHCIQCHQGIVHRLPEGWTRD